jgi:hypothetical protein
MQGCRPNKHLHLLTRERIESITEIDPHEAEITGGYFEGDLRKAVQLFAVLTERVDLRLVDRKEMRSVAMVLRYQPSGVTA